MKLNVHEIDEVAKELDYEEPTDTLNALLMHGAVCDFEFPTAARVHLEYYRLGQDLFFQGHIEGDVTGHCARCLEPYTFDLAMDFSVVLSPKQPLPEQVELSDEDVELTFYEGDTVDLSPVVREQIILALPTRPLCLESCKGLCPQCGASLNTGTCGCPVTPGDSRLAVLRNLRVGH